MKSTGKSSAQIKKGLVIFEKGVERLKELELELNNLDTRGFAYDEQKIRTKLKNVSDIPAIEKEIKALGLKINNKYKPKKKKDRSKVIKRLDKLDDKLDDLKKNSRKKAAPKISKQLEVLNKKLASMEKSSQKRRGNIDSGVGVLIDSDFNAFLTDVKTRLSDRVRGKEAEVESILKSDLQKRELEFKKKHDDLIREFNIKKRNLNDAFEKKYAVQVRSSLKKEVAQKFNSELKKRLDREKVSLGKRYKNEFREKGFNAGEEFWQETR